METEEIYKILKERKDEIIRKTIELLPDALSGDRGNRSFYFSVNETGELTVDYWFYLGNVSLPDTYFYTIWEHQIPDPEDYGYERIEDMDFALCGYDEHIGREIDRLIMN